jgi:hypothetical protein
MRATVRARPPVSAAGDVVAVDAMTVPRPGDFSHIADVTFVVVQRVKAVLIRGKIA